MAVNYPARKFGIKRGDSFEVIQEKSKGKCVAIHLPVTPVDEQYTTTSPTKSPKKESGGVPFNEDWCKGKLYILLGWLICLLTCSFFEK